MILIDVLSSGEQRLTDFFRLIEGLPPTTTCTPSSATTSRSCFASTCTPVTRCPTSCAARRPTFYRSAGDAVTYETWAQGVMVTVAQEGLAQRVFGGDIEPDTKEALTIPSPPKRMEACGRVPGPVPPALTRKATRYHRPPRPKVGDGDNVEALFVLRSRVHRIPTQASCQAPRDRCHGLARRPGLRVEIFNAA
jgi:hypothetical protein